jgi:hypothetical protein
MLLPAPMNRAAAASYECHQKRILNEVLALLVAQETV